MYAGVLLQQVEFYELGSDYVIIMLSGLQTSVQCHKWKKDVHHHTVEDCKMPK